MRPNSIQICPSQRCHASSETSLKPQKSKCPAIGLGRKLISIVACQNLIILLQLTDICVKNGGDHFLAEIGSREFVDNLVSILRMDSLNLQVKTNILRLLQNWSVSFEGKPSLGYVGQTCKTLQNEGNLFFTRLGLSLTGTRLQVSSKGSHCRKFIDG